MKYLIGALCAIVMSMAFSGRKCKHVFTQVEQETVKVERSSGWVYSIYTVPLTGLHEGNEIVCVKCFHMQRQLMDYREASAPMNTLPEGLGRSWSLKDIDSLTNKSNGYFTVKVDSLIWNK